MATTYSISNLLNGLDIITRDKLVISVEKLNAGFFESTLGEQKTFDARKTCKYMSKKVRTHI